MSALGKALVELVLAEVRDDRALQRELLAVLGLERTPTETAYVSVRAYATLHGLGQSTVRTAIREGRLEAVRNGGAIRIRRDALIAPAKQADTPQARAARAWGKVKGGSR